MAQRKKRAERGDPAEGLEHELIVVARSGATLAGHGRRRRADAGARALERLLERHGATLAPLFGPSGARLARAAGALGQPMTRFHRVRVPEEDPERLAELARRLRSLPDVAGAYVKPPSEPAALRRLVLPRPAAAPPVTPDFSARQGYLERAPGGIDARFAWRRPGGDGAGVHLVDVEGDFRFTHEDLLAGQGGLVAGTPPDSVSLRNHGTAVLGVIGGDRNGHGVTGIAPEAHQRGVALGGLGSANAIRLAADLLAPGDLLLVEFHRPGPRFGFVPGPNLQGYIAIEWWPDDQLAIQYATSRGVIVLEVAGNGAEDLDDPLYDVPGPGFPPGWANPFRRVLDPGAILVGAGAPPPGTHGRSHGPDRSRLIFSNYGACLDVQGWGVEVTTCGYGDLQGGPDEDLWYTDQFLGTSSATAVVTGALAATQGALKAAEKPLLTPARARELLRTTGSPQQDANHRPATQRIGNRPDLRRIFFHLGIAKRLRPAGEGARTAARRVRRG